MAHGTYALVFTPQT